MARQTRSAVAWLLLFTLATLLLVSGVQGTTGRVVAALFAPSLLQRDH